MKENWLDAIHGDHVQSIGDVKCDCVAVPGQYFEWAVVGMHERRSDMVECNEDVSCNR